MKNYYITGYLIALLLAACSKEDERAPLAEGVVTFDVPPERDSIQLPISLEADTIIQLNLRAAMATGTSNSNHWVEFAVDTAKLSIYRMKYGSALLMPPSSYFFYKPQVHLQAGQTKSEAAEINIIGQTKLLEYSTYVLPIVIRSVDGLLEGPASSKVLYYVLKTGKPLLISKIGWTIGEVSSTLNAFAASNVIDDNKTGTYWASDITESMPQWITLNFNRDVTFSAVSYALPTQLNYPAQGGYPTSIQIETSMDGINWVNKGTFSGDIVNNRQTLDIGITTARHLRFTALSSVKYSSTYSTIFISDISLVP
ncbi:BT_3987 domain-containing protein [Sphingobacterium sp. 2149]|uniref:BT_3987 domain-containing protein n=1 Tax=Sphingobacterium sp. 2149 TaxID=2817763 RepID=UPI00286531D8|nr:DUF1735 domain-containing protein [Sphingobacterium sp. 2149]MDR6733508.1 hypothetical protein [Sphingobacterium sp. 2149]